jgi:RNA polymerase sigma-70 factor (ECF subfamily)
MTGPGAFDAFEAFVRQHQDMVFATAVRLLGSPTDAEDVAQTVFLRAFQHFGSIRESPAAAGWLKTVTRNLCLNHLVRHRWRWRLFSEMEGRADSEESGLPEDVPDRGSDDSPLAELERSEQQARLEQALHGLPDHQRVPLVLFHFEDMNYQEIARTLGVSIGKVKTDIHRGREALKRHLSADWK